MASSSDIWEKKYNKLIELLDDLNSMNSYVSEPEFQLDTRNNTIFPPVITLLEDLELLAEKEMNRRRDMLAKMRTKLTHMTFPHFDNPDNLLEAERTDLDKSLIVDLLRQIIREQYEGIRKLEETVISTDDIVLPANDELLIFFENVVNKELDLQTWVSDVLDQHMHITCSQLEDDLDLHNDVTYSQLEVKSRLVIEEGELNLHYHEDFNVDEVLEQQVEIDEDVAGSFTLQPLPKRHKQVHNTSTLVDHTTHVPGTTNSNHVMIEIDQNICQEGSEYDVQPMVITLSFGDTIVPNLSTIIDEFDEEMCVDVDELLRSMGTEQFTKTGLERENEGLNDKIVYCEAELHNSIAAQHDLHNHNNNLIKESSISEQPLQHDSIDRNKMSEWKVREEELIHCLEVSKQKLKETIAESKHVVAIKRTNYESQRLQYKEDIRTLKNKLEASEAALRDSEEERLHLAEKRSKLIRDGLKMVVSCVISSEEFEDNLKLVIDYAIQYGRHLGQIAMCERHALDMNSTKLPFYNVDCLDNLYNAYEHFRNRHWTYIEDLATLHDQPLENLEKVLPKRSA